MAADDCLAQASMVVACAERWLDRAADGPGTRAGLAAAFAPAAEIIQGYPRWPVVALPFLVGEGLGVASDRCAGVAAAMALFFASADVIDDAQDGDLAPGSFGGSWAQAVNVGNALIFLALQAAVAATPAGRQAEMADAFARAGLAMSLGQHRDLDQRGPLGAGVTEEDYLACVRGKTGGSFRLFASVGAIAAGADPALVSGLGAYGEALGMARQLANDIVDLESPLGRDRRNQLHTLPVIHAWARLAPDERPLFEASWAAEPDTPPIGFFLDRTGASAYARMRLAVLRTEARMHLDALALPEALACDLAALVAEADPSGPAAAA